MTTHCGRLLIVFALINIYLFEFVCSTERSSAQQRTPLSLCYVGVTEYGLLCSEDFKVNMHTHFIYVHINMYVIVRVYFHIYVQIF